MINKLIYNKTKEWFSLADCPAKDIINYIKKKAALREPQIEAIEVYLYLKIAGENKPLWQLFSEGFFVSDLNLSELAMSQHAREYLERHKGVKAFYDYSLIEKNGLDEFILTHYNKVDFELVIKQIFYNVTYTDFLFSLPMGAGKTFLMASFMYLDLYFAQNEPENKIFAHNFLVLIPSGLKSSIGPSLKTIEDFDPKWVIPEPAASNIKKLIKFEILDQPKTAKKSNKARNPNAQKVAQYQPFDELMGLVMIVNAEKVILDRIDIVEVGETYKIDFHEDEEDIRDKQANELRHLIRKIPNLQIHIDEVHHAATDEIKLRQVVNNWNKYGTVNSVLGYSGTPYLEKADVFKINENYSIKFSHITNTVFFYSLPKAIEKFLKKPRVEQASRLTSLQIIQKGVEDFYKHYGKKKYKNGTIAKLAIYCGGIPRLEEEVYPFLTGKLGIHPKEILKYHGGDKKYKLTQENRTEFLSLDTPLSKKKIVLLVQIGKEGWDCRSLTGVILSQKGDCPQNMVLQTSTRCLREVDKGENETAVIWLNEDNAKKLDKQLKDEQQSSIEQLNKLSKETEKTVQRYSRMDYLKLPPVEFYQLKINYKITTEEKPDIGKNIKNIKPANYLNQAIIAERGLTNRDIIKTDVIATFKGEEISFYDWIFSIYKGSLESLSLDSLLKYEAELEKLFNEFTISNDGNRYYNELYDYEKINSQIRLTYQSKRSLSSEEVIDFKPEELLIIENLDAVKDHKKIYPREKDVKTILEFDKNKKSPEKELEKIKKTFEDLGYDNEVPMPFGKIVMNKDRTFHYIPYDFWQSSFEMEFLDEALTLTEIHDKGLEIYYNGEKHLTNFKILCYAKNGKGWKPVGKYTPDFLIIKRDNNKIIKALIIETKGSGFKDQPEFIKRKEFTEGEFLKMNNDRFKYQKFDFLYLSDEDDMKTNLIKLNDTVKKFFN